MYNRYLKYDKYVWYIKYMKQYSYSQTRASLKDVLNEAQFKGPVQIKRYDTIFELRVIGDDARSYQKAVNDAEDPEIINEAKPEVNGLKADKVIVDEAADFRWCKNGHPIPEGKTKCMGKGCKYS